MSNMFKIMAAALAASTAAMDNRVYGASAIAAAIRRMRRYDHRLFAKGSIAQLNRHTGQPHEHRREIARRQRQAAR